MSELSGQKSPEMLLASAAFSIGGRARLGEVGRRDILSLTMALSADVPPDALRVAVFAFLSAGQSPAAGNVLQESVRAWLAERGEVPAELPLWQQRRDCGHD